jgi:transcriptional regulator with XRE-family HTH domain
LITMSIVRFKGEEIVEVLKEARLAAGLSQRALSARAGLAQSHVSEIEKGSKDPGLSKLIDVARALDLELVLVPRKMLPAVESLIHPAEGERRSPAYAIEVLDRAERQVKKQQALYGPNASLDRMREALKFLRHAPVKPKEIERIKADTEELRRHMASPQSAELVKTMASEWMALRNRLAHAAYEAPRPAFSLDDEDDDA